MLFLLGDPHEDVEGLVVEPGIRGMGHALGLDRGVHDDLLEALGLDGLAGQACFNGELEQLLAALRPDAFAPAGELGGVDGEPVLEELFPANELPVWVFNPPGNHLLVGELEGGSSLFRVGSRRLKPGHSRVQEPMMAPLPGIRHKASDRLRLPRYRLPAMESVRGQKRPPTASTAFPAGPQAGRALVSIFLPAIAGEVLADRAGRFGFRPAPGNAGAALPA